MHLVNVVFFVHREKRFIEAFGKLFLFGGGLCRVEDTARRRRGEGGIVDDYLF